jgi:hypothetical protein
VLYAFSVRGMMSEPEPASLGQLAQIGNETVAKPQASPVEGKKLAAPVKELARRARV